VDERLIRQRWDKVDSLLTTQDAICRLLDVWVKMDRIDDLHIRIAPTDLSQGGADVFERLAKVLPTVGGDKD